MPRPDGLLPSPSSGALRSITGPPGRGLRVAFAGAGHWHFAVDARYLELAREAECEIVGLQDDDEPTARRRAQEAGCPWTTDVTDLVERFRPDFVIATPRPDRAPAQVSTLLDLGMPLFAEKPLGLDAKRVWPLVEPSEHGWVTVAFPNRYLPLWDHVQRAAGSGRPDILHFSARLVKGSPARYVDFGVPWMLDPAIGGGGPIRNFGIHFADLVCRYIGRSAAVLGATLTHQLHRLPIEDHGFALLEAGGARIALEVGYTHASPTGNDSEFRVALRDAYLIQRATGLEIHSLDRPREHIPPPDPTGYRASFFDALCRFRRGDPPIAGVRDCALANQLVDDIYAAARYTPIIQ